MIEKVEINPGHIADVDEVALLFAMSVTVAAFKQLDLALGSKLVVVMEGDRGHASLVRLARAIDVEIAETDDLRRGFRQTPAHDLIKEELGVTVDVERRLA